MTNTSLIDDEDFDRLSKYFVSASVKRFMQIRHPYDFVETYRILREVFSYQTNYVNFGYWRQGMETIEPGRMLAQELAALLQLRQGDSLIDVGSGLGQAAIDLCKQYTLCHVVGINTNWRQVAFANATARDERLENRVVHVVGDACRDLGEYSGKGYKHIMALECVNHFSNPLRFFESAREVVGPNGRIALCLNIAGEKIKFLQTNLLKLAFGFSPVTIEQWIERMENAGFVNLQVKDITHEVLDSSFEFALARLEGECCNIPLSIKLYLRLQLKMALQSVRQGALKYYALAGEASSCTKTEY